MRYAPRDETPISRTTSWTSLLSVLEHEAADDPAARGDLAQLHALCEAADDDAFLPVAAETLTDQRTPAFMLQLSSVVQDAIDRAVSAGILNLKGTMPQASAVRIGRYAYFGKERRAGVWLGLHFRLWKRHGATPVWAVFDDSDWGRGREVQARLEPWATRESVLATKDDNGSYVVALDLPAGEEKGAMSLIHSIEPPACSMHARPPLLFRLQCGLLSATVSLHGCPGYRFLQWDSSPFRRLNGYISKAAGSTPGEPMALRDRCRKRGGPAYQCLGVARSSWPGHEPQSGTQKTRQLAEGRQQCRLSPLGSQQRS